MDKKSLSITGWLLTTLLVLVLGYQIIAGLARGPAIPGTWPPYQWGLLVLLLAYFFSIAVTGSVNPVAIGAGDDGKLSLSKTQTLFWTYIVLFSFSTIYAQDVQWCAHPGSVCPPPPASTPAPAPTPAPSASPTQASLAGTAAIGTNPLIPIDFPGSVLLLLGFSVTSLVAAAGITRSQIASGTLRKNTLAKGQPPDLSPKWLVMTDDERVDLTRFQVVLWTLVAAGAFLSDTQLLLAAGGFVRGLPDVGSALVLLMGLGQAAYVGGKLVVAPRPQIYRIAPSHAAAGGSCTASGAGFGATSPPESCLLFDGAVVPVSNIVSWADTAIAFTVPAAPPAGGTWPAAPTQLQVSVATGPVVSDPVPFTVP